MSGQQFSMSDLMDVLVQQAGLPDEACTDDGTATFADVGLDSLAFLQLQTELQARYGFELPDDRTHIYTFGDIVTSVNARLAPSLPTTGHTDNSILINAGIAVVWELTNNVESWPDLFTEYASVEVLDRHGDTVRFRLTMHPDDNGKVWSWVSERTAHPDEWRVVSRRVEPGAFQYMNLEWTYLSEDGGTRLRWVQDFAMRPDAPIDDAAMTERINTNTRIQMDVIRQKVESVVRERT